jgi:hypothetical protein
VSLPHFGIYANKTSRRWGAVQRGSYRVRTLFALSLVGISSVSFAQTQVPLAPLVVPPPAAAPAAPHVNILKRDTPVELMATSEIRSDGAPAGTKFKLRVNAPITVDGKLVVPVGATAYGIVTSAEASGGVGKSGKLSAKLLYIQIGDLQIPLEGETSNKGAGAGSAALSVVFVGVMGLFHRGNNAKIKAGEILTGFVAEDVPLDLSSTPIKRATAQ